MLGIFTLEMVLKLIGLGFRNYFDDSFNIFDCFIVLMSYIDVLVPENSAPLKMLKAFRILRIFKIIRSWGSLRILLSAVADSFTPIRNLAVLICLFCFVVALFFKQIFSSLTLKTENGATSRY